MVFSPRRSAKSINFWNSLEIFPAAAFAAWALGEDCQVMASDEVQNCVEIEYFFNSDYQFLIGCLVAVMDVQAD